jgi:hypothetical protein
MNFLKKGPDLNLSSLRSGDLKVPPFLSDLYYDLRDRRLLPLVALVVVGIVAVPFLLGKGSEEEAPQPAGGGGGGPAAAVAGASGGGPAKLAVVESTPGLREYKKRLRGRTETDPFHQKFAGPQTAGTQLTHTTVTSTGSPSPTTTTTTTTFETSTPESSAPVHEGSPGGAPAGPSSPPPGKAELTFYSWAIDVRITKSEAGSSASDAGSGNARPVAGTSGSKEKPAAKESQDPSVRHEVLPYTKLPGDKAPVVTYMNLSKQGRPLFLVSSKVKSVFGEVKCVSGDDSCQLIEVEPTFPVVFVYGEGEVHYTINVLKKELVITGHKTVDTQPTQPRRFSK